MTSTTQEHKAIHFASIGTALTNDHDDDAAGVVYTVSFWVVLPSKFALTYANPPLPL